LGFCCISNQIVADAQTHWPQIATKRQQHGVKSLCEGAR